MPTTELGAHEISRDGESPEENTFLAWARAVFFPVGYFVRNGLVLWAAALVLAAEIVVLAQRGMQWRGDLIWTIDWLPVSFIMVGPIVAGFAAMDTARTANGAAHMFRNPVARTPAVAITMAYAAVIGLTHFLSLGIALAFSRPPVLDAGAPLAVLVQMLIITFFIALGTAVGRFAGPVLAGVCGALAAFAAVYLFSAPSSEYLVLLEIGGATLPRIGYAYGKTHLSFQAAALVLLILALLVLRPLEGSRRHSVTVRDGAVAVALLVCVAAISVGVKSQRLTAVDAQPTYCGAVITVPTCFYPQHERIAPAYQEQFWTLVEAAQNKGYEGLLPTRVEEASRTRLPASDEPTTAAFFVMPDNLQGAQPTLYEMVLGLVQPMHCSQVQQENPPSERYWADLDALVATWVGLVDPAAAAEIGYQGDPLTSEEATDLIESFRTCTYAHF